ncbi:hypothetical protein BU23DRAFT_67200 [Bimuria novae-zelandiae CBS 107.79]|uniref:Uncharacterized protein n=1 Tax=Bimuria novae-zelandiae CBS 107.79 TaxID=1447943 RepID=A0A6A5VH75_9PLEO|nr:hypothetical protein BU23DRAFT_67200 [Bimuria novae-zelandiae CBS 107.79]
MPMGYLIRTRLITSHGPAVRTASCNHIHCTCTSATPQRLSSQLPPLHSIFPLPSIPPVHNSLPIPTGASNQVLSFRTPFQPLQAYN